MSDKEKAKEYVDKIKRQYLLSEEGLGCAEQGYLDGLAEGRKESLDVLICEQEHNQMLIKENKTMKTILLDVFKKHGDLCSLCEVKGQKLPECKCMKDNECLEHIIELYGGAK